MGEKITAKQTDWFKVATRFYNEWLTAQPSNENTKESVLENLQQTNWFTLAKPSKFPYWFLMKPMHASNSDS